MTMNVNTILDCLAYSSLGLLGGYAVAKLVLSAMTDKQP